MWGFNLFRSHQTVSRSQELRDRTRFHFFIIGSLVGAYVFLEHRYGAQLAERYGTAKRSVLGLMGK